MLFSYLVLSPPLSSLHSVPLRSSCPFFSSPLCFLSRLFLPTFWLNKLVSLMSSDTSGLSHSCLITKWLWLSVPSAFCVRLFSGSYFLGPSLRPLTRCRLNQGFVSDHSGLLLWVSFWLFAADLGLLCYCIFHPEGKRSLDFFTATYFLISHVKKLTGELFT